MIAEAGKMAVEESGREEDKETEMLGVNAVDVQRRPATRQLRLGF